MHGPGAWPHFLNGALDLINGRVALGAARLIYAGLIVVAISTGLLLGLTLLSVSLPTDPVGRIVPLWQDVIAAGIAVASYSMFFFQPVEHAALAGRGRYAGPRFKVVGHQRARLRSSDRCFSRLHLLG